MGEKKSGRNQTSRKERKAKKRAAEDLIPDIPVSETEFSSSVNEEKSLDKKANTTDLHGNKKRKRNRADEEGVAEEDDHDEKEKDEEKSDEKKKRKRSKNQSNKESKFDNEIDNNYGSVKRDIEKRDEEELPVKDKEEEKSKKKKKEKGKEHKTQKIPNSRDVITDGEENSSVLDQQITSQKSKKERKAEVNVDTSKLGDNDSNHKESEAKVDEKNKVTTNTDGKETSNEDDTTTKIEEKKTSNSKKDKKKKKKKNMPTKLLEQQGESTPSSTSEDTSLLSKKTATTTAVAAGGGEGGGGKNTSETLSAEKASSNGTTKSGARFIVFVGNLPYTATTNSIMSHFSKLKPVSVRHLTKKDDPSKSRGIAFVEFENYDTHKTALKIMHHSIFDDNLSEPRMINVELTAGGGGNTEDRKAKIKSKNERLNEQRIRRKEEEEKAKIKKEEEKAKLSKGPLSEAAQSSSESNIHPSRRRMITA